MTVLPFLAIAFGAAAASLLTRHYPKVSAGIGIAGLASAAIAATRISATDSLTIGGGVIAGSEYLRLFAILGCLVSLALAVLGHGGRAATATRRGSCSPAWAPPSWPCR